MEFRNTTNEVVEIPGNILVSKSVRIWYRILAGQTFTGKLSVAVAGGLTGLILTTIGYVPNAEQTETALNGMFFCIALLPALGALVRIFIMSRYTFTEDQHAILREKLERGEFAEGVAEQLVTTQKATT